MGKRQPTALEIATEEPRIVLLYESGMTIKDLIPIVKLGRRSILSVLKKHGIPIKNRAPRKPPLRRIAVTIPLETHKLISDYAESQGLFLIEAAQVLIRAGFNALNPEIPQNPQSGNATTKTTETPSTTLHSTHFTLEGVHREAQFNPSNDSLRGEVIHTLLAGGLPFETPSKEEYALKNQIANLINRPLRGEGKES